MPVKQEFKTPTAESPISADKESETSVPRSSGRSSRKPNLQQESGSPKSEVLHDLRWSTIVQEKGKRVRIFHFCRQHQRVFETPRQDLCNLKTVWKQVPEVCLEKESATFLRRLNLHLCSLSKRTKKRRYYAKQKQCLGRQSHLP